MSSPVIRDDGFFVVERGGGVRSPSGPAGGGRSRCCALRQPCPLTFPLLCSVAGGWLEVEGAHQVQRGITQLEVVQRRPQVDDVPLLATACLKTVEHVLLE